MSLVSLSFKEEGSPRAFLTELVEVVLEMTHGLRGKSTSCIFVGVPVLLVSTPLSSLSPVVFVLLFLVVVLCLVVVLYLYVPV